MEQITLHIKPRPPFRLDLTIWALRRQLNNKIDLWDGKTYTRIFVMDGQQFKVEVTQENPLRSSRLSVLISGHKLVSDQVKRETSVLLSKILGTDVELGKFYQFADKDGILSPLASRFVGLKPPRFPTIFEALINAFACQQLSLSVGITLLNRLSETYGASFGDDFDSPHAFPTPEDLASAEPAMLRKLGFSRNKGQAIITLARSVLDKKIDLKGLELMNDQEAVDSLQQIAGVGRWSAEYVLLRGLRRLNVFPGDDVGARNNLQQFLSLKDKPDYATVKRIMLRWKPYQGFVYFHFLLEKLRSKGFL
jgi:DNA-3-methyladenine glycosylase II